MALYFDSDTNQLGITTQDPDGVIGITTITGFVDPGVYGDVPAMQMYGLMVDTTGSVGSSGSVLISTSAGVAWTTGADPNSITHIVIQEEGSYLGQAKTLNFVGSNVTASIAGTASTITFSDDPIFTGLTVNGSTTINGNLNVRDNVTIGGTSVQLNAKQLVIEDADIIVGLGTTFSPNDFTASHGGIAVASTEGIPIVNFQGIGGETLPNTYKKIMWFRGADIGVGYTDAWLFNYGVGIGTTQVPNGVRFAAGGTIIDDSTISSPIIDGVLTQQSIRGQISTSIVSSDDFILVYDSDTDQIHKATIQDAALQGIQGTLGLQGDLGSQGLQGDLGSQGHQGVQGLQGTQGTQGLQGDLGSQGHQGIQGLQGTQGTQGLQGDLGSQGHQGVQGLQGIQGTQGTQGLQGDLGSQGHQGVQGLQGTQGTQGLQGDLGSQGHQGLDGAFAGQGVQGLQGESIQGTIGVQGPAGSPGSGGGGESYWASSTLGIHTLSHVGIATTNPLTELQVNGTISFGSNKNILLGDTDTGASLASAANDNILIGAGAGRSITNSDRNIFIGQQAGLVNTTIDNIFIGAFSGLSNTSGGGVFVGGNSGINNTTGDSNVFIGGYSGNDNISGSSNLGLGWESFYGNQTGSSNLYLGNWTGFSTAASYKVIIGTGNGGQKFDSPDVTSGGAGKNKQLAIGLNTTGTREYWIVGNENLNIGIGTTNPTEKLHVGGNLRVTGGIYDFRNNVGAAGSILTSTGTGVSWTTPFAAGLQGVQGAQGVQGLQGTSGPVAGSANQIVYKDSSNTATGSNSLTYSGPSSGIGSVGIGTIIKLVHTDLASPANVKFTGPAGTLLTITNNLTSGSIFAVNDATAIPAIDVNANGTVTLVGFGGSVGVGITLPTRMVDLNGTVRLRSGVYDSNNIVGVAGSILTSTGAGVSWTTPFAAGLQGLQGLQGNQGTQGLQGTLGSQGVQGLQGTQGLQGDLGSQGSSGSNGSQGAQGLQGTQGLQGDLGSQGSSGSNGSQGVQGLQGSNGSQGAQGLQGSSGSDGAQGSSGSNGSQGAQGLQGSSGSDGSQGAQGLQGSSGSDGAQGSSGSNGSQGAQGLQGDLGSQGLQGLQGTSIQGMVGIQGASGSGGGGGGGSYLVKTSNYTAISGDSIVSDTSGGSFTITLPATPTSGDYITVADGSNWETNNLTIGRNGSTIEGIADDLVLDVQGITIDIVYDGSTWEAYPSVSKGVQGVQGISGVSGSIIPGISTSVSYTLQASDSGKHVAITTSITVPANVFSSGDAIVIINDSSVRQTITSGAGITMYLAGTASTGTRYLEQRGVANILCFRSNTFTIVGAGLT